MTQCKSDEKDKLADIIAECTKYGIKMLPPDINISDDNFEATEEGIRYKLTAITEVGKSAIKAIRNLRPISSFEDMIERGERRTLKKNVIENLIKAGVFDAEEPNRIKLLNKLYELRGIEQNIPDNMWNDRLRCMFEKESLGVYLSEHPIEKYFFKNITEFNQNELAVIGGEVIDVAQIYDKKGNPMAFVTISNQYGTTKGVVFSYVWTNNSIKAPQVLQEGNLVVLKGKRSGNDILVEECAIL